MVVTRLRRLSPYSAIAHSVNCKHIFRMITYSINAPQCIASMFSQTGTDVLVGLGSSVG